MFGILGIKDTKENEPN